MKLIPLSAGLHAKVDDSDYEILSRFRWRAQVWRRRRKDGTIVENRYAARSGGKRLILMHRAIMRDPPGREIDHRNGDGLDNQRGNLRIATHQQNQANRRSTRSASGFRGVRRDEDRSGAKRQWRAYINYNGKPHHIGRFETPTEAARMYDQVAKIVWGEFATLNFPRGK